MILLCFFEYLELSFTLMGDGLKSSYWYLTITTYQKQCVTVLRGKASSIHMLQSSPEEGFPNASVTAWMTGKVSWQVVGNEYQPQGHTTSHKRFIGRGKPSSMTASVRARSSRELSRIQGIQGFCKVRAFQSRDWWAFKSWPWSFYSVGVSERAESGGLQL